MERFLSLLKLREVVFFFFLSNTVLQGLDIDYRKTLASFLWNYSDLSFLLKQIFEKPLKVGGVNWEIGIGIYTRKVLVSQSYPTLCDPMDYSPPGSSVHGILQQEYWSG